MTSSWKRTFLALGALLAALPFASVASGQVRDEYGDEAIYQENDVVQTVARISHLQGTVSYARGDEPDDWQPADYNVPMTLGDRLYTGRRSRLELQVHGGDVIWVGSRTDLAVLNLTEDTKQFAMKSGVGSFQIRQLEDDDVWEVDTPNAAITFERPGLYRVDVDRDGNTRVSVERGAATVAAGGGQISLNSGEAVAIDGIDSPRYDVLAVSSQDTWDGWVTGRSGRFRRSASYNYISADIVGADDLDTHGSWRSIPDYGMAWSPSSIEVGWTPYRQGHWMWQDPWGWTWISTERWGWAPYHYGRWVTWSSRWYWVPGPRAVRVTYAPALVAFVGGSPGFSASVTIGGGGYVGWFPLAPREAYVPWWSPRPTVNINVTNVTYINRTYVTVVNQSTFVSGGIVARHVVTDRTVVREVVSAPVIHGTVPVLPTLASTRVSARAAVSAPRPPAAILARPVVARVAPPPAPPRFEQKLALIRENRAPVQPAVAARLATQTEAQPRAAIPVRPVVAQPGRVTLAPRAASSSTSARVQAVPPVAPVAPVRGRPLATSERPVAPGPVVGSKSRAARSTSTATTPEGSSRPAVPDQRPGVDRERVEPSQPEARPQAPRAQEPAQAAPESRRPTAAIERREREVATPNRPEAQRQRAPVPPQQDERLRPTAAREEQPVRQVQPESRVPPERERAQTPDWRKRAQPAPQVERPTREAPPQRERAQEAPPQRERAQAEPGRVVTPPPSREVVRPEARRPAERPVVTGSVERAPRKTPKPNRTPKKDDKKTDEDRNPN